MNYSTDVILLVQVQFCKEENLPKPTNQEINTFWRNKVYYRGSEERIEQGFNEIIKSNFNQKCKEDDKITVESLNVLKKFIAHEFEKNEKNSKKTNHSGKS